MKWLKHLKRIFIVLLVIVGFLAALEFSPWALSYSKTNAWINETSKPWIIPHGGAKALYPENTIYAFNQTAMYDAFEVDLTLTKDNVLISHHDLDLRHDLLLDEVNDGLVIRKLTYEDIVDLIVDNDYPYVRQFVDVDGNTPYATTTDTAILNQMLPMKLEDLFQAYPDRRYILEIKDVRTDDEDTFNLAANQLLSLIEQYDMADKVMVSSFSDEVIEHFLDISEHKIHASTATNETLKMVLLSAFNLDFFYKPTYAALAIPIDSGLSDSQGDLIGRLPSLISSRIAHQVDGQWRTNLAQASLVKDAHRHNMSVIFWTVNSEEDMLKLIELGVDGIITDRPDLLFQLYETLGIA
ncbi:glycerophosphodiester phosphodiesterase family protein [Paracholeplasma manati]|uniref:Glycerophosphodiester phosphodiesterase family protein n=1 Tax=Paracholeplasma manati TaxID=591373 RepID=A0ABT2Y6S4_9MOLU|nr:glycerophosphodiester phosphodiesterase family protein [Paracholeplasma manati]MCV2232441.1 glycerophosphodiester phosphodiesterase family protein [Paracholeplasma manati]MDG0887973.1 glycerophosphodiester phosphodiesterase family protein [Paracholeplasma manati]